MEIIEDWGRQPRPEYPAGAVFTLGVFDGLHRGHRALIDLVIKQARRRGVQALALTFEPHPLAVLAPGAAPPLLTSPAQKAELLAAWGLDILGALRFDQELANLAPEEFLNRYLAPFIEPVAAALGPDFAFGRGARGEAGALRAWLARNRPGAEVLQAEPAAGAHGVFSSSKIRQNLKEGLTESAAQDLGRPYRLAGLVVRGQARGRTLGFPTANLGRIGQLIPGAGVYAVRVQLGPETFSGMTGIGYNPTFGEKSLTVETHILDFDRSIYGQPLALDFIARLRPMIRFDSVEQLKIRLMEDRRNARKALDQAGV